MDQDFGEKGDGCSNWYRMMYYNDPRGVCHGRPFIIYKCGGVVGMGRLMYCCNKQRFTQSGSPLTKGYGEICPCGFIKEKVSWGGGKRCRCYEKRRLS